VALFFYTNGTLIKRTSFDPKYRHLISKMEVFVCSQDKISVKLCDFDEEKRSPKLAINGIQKV
jgi:hypothetical protein